MNNPFDKEKAHEVAKIAKKIARELLSREHYYLFEERLDQALNEIKSQGKEKE